MILLCWLLGCPLPPLPARPPIEIGAVAYVRDPLNGKRFYYIDTDIRSALRYMHEGDTLMIHGGTYVNGMLVRREKGDAKRNQWWR